MLGCTCACAAGSPAAETVSISTRPLDGEGAGARGPPRGGDGDEGMCQVGPGEAAPWRDPHPGVAARTAQLCSEELVQREREEAEEQLRCELEEAAERKQREHTELEERSRRAREELVQAEAARQSEMERAAKEQKRKQLVAAFLKEHGYKDVTTPKRTMLKTKYPIHTAAKLGDLEILRALLEEGADPSQKDSSGQTAAHVAQSKNENFSHSSVMLALGVA